MKKTIYKIRVHSPDGAKREYIEQFGKREAAREAAMSFIESGKFPEVEIVEYELEEKGAETIKPKPLYKPLWEDEK